MTKRDFNELAALVKMLADTNAGERPALRVAGQTYIPVEVLARELATFCSYRNARFDRERFLKACGVES